MEKSIDSKFEGDYVVKDLTRVFLKNWNEPIHLKRLNVLVTELPWSSKNTKDSSKI